MTFNILHFFLYADDTNIYYEAESPEKLEHMMNKELRKLHKWCVVNRLSLNIDKTNFIVFHPYNKPFEAYYNFKISQESYIGKTYIKYLGLMIDSTLSWHTHIKHNSNKMSRGIGLLYKIRPIVNIKIMKTLYYSFIYPHLLYAIEVSGSAGTSDINSLSVLQKIIIRLLLCLIFCLFHFS